MNPQEAVRRYEGRIGVPLRQRYIPVSEQEKREQEEIRKGVISQILYGNRKGDEIEAEPRSQERLEHFRRKFI